MIMVAEDDAIAIVLAFRMTHQPVAGERIGDAARYADPDEGKVALHVVVERSRPATVRVGLDVEISRRLESALRQFGAVNPS